MIAINVKNVKTFMNKLLLTDTFDNYLVSEITITTFATFSIDGKFHHDFYEPGQAEELRSAGKTQISWKEVKSYCLSIIKGKRSPLAFKFVLQLPQDEVALLLARSGLSLIPEDVFGLYFNCQFAADTLTITTGSSLRVFTLDKSLDNAWDQCLESFLTTQEIE